MKTYTFTIQLFEDFAHKTEKVSFQAPSYQSAWKQLISFIPKNFIYAYSTIEKSYVCNGKRRLSK